MIRLYYDVVEKIYLILLWVKYVAKVPEINRIEEEINNLRSNIGDPEQRANAQEAMRSAFSGEDQHQIDGLIQLFSKFITRKRSKSESTEGDLIDLIVKTLQLPFTAAVLAGRTLNNLRKALLLPEELTGLTSRLVKQEKCCMSCGKDFEPGEAMIYYEPSDSNSTSTIMCFACSKPEMVKCGNCKESVPFGDVYATKRSKGCENHKKKETSEGTTPDDNPFRPPEPVIFGSRRGRTSGRLRDASRNLRAESNRFTVSGVGTAAINPTQGSSNPRATLAEEFWGDLGRSEPLATGFISGDPSIAVDIETPVDTARVIQWVQEQQVNQSQTEATNAPIAVEGPIFRTR